MTSFISLVFRGFTSACSVALPRIDISPSLDSAQGEELVLYVMTRCDAENKDRHRQGKDMDPTSSARSYSDNLHSDASDGVNKGKNNNHFQNSNASDDGKRTSVTSLASATPKTFNTIQTKGNASVYYMARTAAMEGSLKVTAPVELLQAMLDENLAEGTYDKYGSDEEDEVDVGGTS
eukprot:gene2447-2938_t